MKLAAALVERALRRGAPFLRRALTLALLVLCGCETAIDVVNCTALAFFENEENGPQPPDTAVIYAVAETEPVTNRCDAADDAAIWGDVRTPDNSKIIVTNKTGKLGVHALNGSTLVERKVGRMNNVDVRDAVPISGTPRIVFAASNRSKDTIDVFELSAPSGEFSNLLAEPIPAFESGIYGICLYRSADDGKLYVFANGKEGEVGQWRLDDTGKGQLAGTPVRHWLTGTSVEGCVADDANGWLHLGAEDEGIWRYDADPNASTEHTVVDITGLEQGSGGHLHGDVEGLALYADPSGEASEGYLIASSQGNSTYVVYDRAAPHRYRGTFRVGDRGSIDGVQFTDGLDVTSRPLGPAFPLGMLAIMDGRNTNPDGTTANQNFKLVSWADVAEALDL